MIQKLRGFDSALIVKQIDMAFNKLALPPKKKRRAKTVEHLSATVSN